MADSRLNFFLHFRKAGGTRIVNLAIANGERLWPRHDNGKPCDGSGATIDLSSMNHSDATDFFNEAIGKKISFVSASGGKELVEAALAHPNVRTICSLRNPGKTCLSNYNYDYYLALTNERKLSSYLHHAGYSNPFTISLLGHGHPEHREEESVNEAIRLLQQFDLLIRLGDPDSDSKTRDETGWSNFEVKSHSTSGEDRPWKIYNLMVKGRIIRAFELMSGKKRGNLKDVPINSIKLDSELMERLFEID
ncbi:MAG: hypothetical protein CBD52_005910 [Euryarchaeota archaeon TMED192]|nr:MAG: hypothetical protein CBD52_005910 [Euryarchaeota archaeon TMED192]|tara:strand:- start:4110 stop:4859 length:750 start_codon:yes stop_codon:yes gene_type:complete